MESGIVRHYPRLSLSEERRLISRAQKGSRKSKDELVLRHIGFLIFRIHKKVFPVLIRRFGGDLLEEGILITYKKIESYDLDYRDKQGNPNPVKFVSYIWKRIDGFIIDFLKRELNEHKRIKVSIFTRNWDLNNIGDGGDGNTFKLKKLRKLGQYKKA